MKSFGASEVGSYVNLAQCKRFPGANCWGVISPEVWNKIKINAVQAVCLQQDFKLKSSSWNKDCYKPSTLSLSNEWSSLSVSQFSDLSFSTPAKFNSELLHRGKSELGRRLTMLYEWTVLGLSLIHIPMTLQLVALCGCVLVRRPWF